MTYNFENGITISDLTKLLDNHPTLQLHNDCVIERHELLLPAGPFELPFYPGPSPQAHAAARDGKVGSAAGSAGAASSGSAGAPSTTNRRRSSVVAPGGGPQSPAPGKCSRSFELMYFVDLPNLLGGGGTRSEMQRRWDALEDALTKALAGSKQLRMYAEVFVFHTSLRHYKHLFPPELLKNRRHPQQVDSHMDDGTPFTAELVWKLVIVNEETNLDTAIIGAARHMLCSGVLAASSAVGRWRNDRVGLPEATIAILSNDQFRSELQLLAPEDVHRLRVSFSSGTADRGSSVVHSAVLVDAIERGKRCLRVVFAEAGKLRRQGPEYFDPLRLVSAFVALLTTPKPKDDFLAKSQVVRVFQGVHLNYDSVDWWRDRERIRLLSLEDLGGGGMIIDSPGPGEDPGGEVIEALVRRLLHLGGSVAKKRVGLRLLLLVVAREAGISTGWLFANFFDGQQTLDQPKDWNYSKTAKYDRAMLNLFEVLNIPSCISCSF